MIGSANSFKETLGEAADPQSANGS